jgi:hypothetical protein
MAELELEGAVRGKTWRTTIPAAVASRPADLVERDFSAAALRAMRSSSFGEAAAAAGTLA